MESRIVKTKFWQDDKVQKLSFTARYLFLYLITSPYARLTNYYELNDNYIKLETGMSEEQITKSKLELEKFGLAYFYEGWVFVPNMDKHNRYSVGKLTGKGYQKELNNIPKFILDYFNNKKDTSIKGVSYLYDTPRNNKLEIINNKPEIINNNRDRDREIIREKEKEKEKEEKNNIYILPKEKKEKFPTPQAELVSYFAEIFEKRFGNKYLARKEEFIMMANLLKVYSPEDLKKYIRRFLYLEKDQFPAKLGFRIGIFYKFINEVISNASPYSN